MPSFAIPVFVAYGQISVDFQRLEGPKTAGEAEFPEAYGFALLSILGHM